MNFSDSIENIQMASGELKKDGISCGVSIIDSSLVDIFIKNEDRVVEQFEYDMKNRNVVFSIMETKGEHAYSFFEKMNRYNEEYDFFIMKTERTNYVIPSFEHFQQDVFENGVFFTKKTNKLLCEVNAFLERLQAKFQHSCVRKYKYTDYYRFCIITIWGNQSFEIHPTHFHDKYILQRKGFDDEMLEIDTLVEKVERFVIRQLKKEKMNSLFDEDIHPFYHLMNNHLHTSIHLSKKTKKKMLQLLKKKFESKQLIKHCFDLMTIRQNEVIAKPNIFLIPFPGYILLGKEQDIYEFYNQEEALAFFSNEESGIPYDFKKHLLGNEKR